MNREKFTSVFAREINLYLDYKIESDFQEKSFYYNLRKFDQFCSDENIQNPVFTKENADKWILQRAGEVSTTHYSRVNTIKGFLIYMARKGYEVYVTRDIRFRPTNFQPHIYSDQEIQKYFYAVDHHEWRCRKYCVELPVLFRTLYCCGTRINETLGLRKSDVDLQAGILRLLETKNNNERYIVLGADLGNLYRRFADKTFYLISDDDYIFSNERGYRLDGDYIYEIHRRLLLESGIPFVGGNEGPRLHDWRHTFAVRSFKQLVDKGYDMYVALPILSAYLGHKTIYATEKYVRLTCSVYPYIGEKYSKQLDMIYRDGDIYEIN